MQVHCDKIPLSSDFPPLGTTFMNLHSFNLFFFFFPLERGKMWGDSAISVNLFAVSNKHSFDLIFLCFEYMIQLFEVCVKLHKCSACLHKAHD